tara:strand:- start:16 stop:453 length:438 start_codon:yes stop_codon:yes gene_type:complete
MSSYSDIPSSRPLRPSQQGNGLFGTLKKVFKAAPILSTAASFLPGPAKLAAPILASQGLGQKRKVRRRRKPQQGGLKLKSLAKAVVPILKQTKLVSRTLAKGGPKAQLASKGAAALGFGQRKRLKKGGRKRKVVRRPQLVPVMAM